MQREGRNSSCSIGCTAHAPVWCGWGWLLKWALPRRQKRWEVHGEHKKEWGQYALKQQVAKIAILRVIVVASLMHPCAPKARE